MAGFVFGGVVKRVAYAIVAVGLVVFGAAAVLDALRRARIISA